MGTSIVSFAADEFVTDRNWDHGRDEMNRNVLLKRCMRPSQTDRAPKVTILTNRDGHAIGRCQLSTAPGLWPDPKGVVTVGSKAAIGSVSMRLWNGSYLLTGAGFSRNWGGWLANEVFEYLLADKDITVPIRTQLWRDVIRRLAGEKWRITPSAPIRPTNCNRAEDPVVGHCWSRMDRGPGGRRGDGVSSCVMMR
jgi:hypothetical protein